MRKAFHEIRPDADWSFRGLEYFLELVQAGSHQSCEAAFSQTKEFTPEGERWAPYIAALRVSSTDAFAKYERTIIRFAFGDFKRRRHAVRLSFNLRALRRSGCFDPLMTDDEIQEANALATRLSDFALVSELLPGIRLDEARIGEYIKLGRTRLGRD